MDNWEQRLQQHATELGLRLSQSHPAKPVRRRLRIGRAAFAGCLMFCLVFAMIKLGLQGRPDPAAVIEARYSHLDRLQGLLKTTEWNPDARRRFEEALRSVDGAILLAKDAVRKAPGNNDYTEICDITFQSKERLLNAYLAAQGGNSSVR